jgi:hypothetical protein
MGLFETITESGTIVPLDSRWDGEWRADARRLEDHRSERFDTPQYQNDADRDAAVARHGDTVACSVCAPAEVPVD